MVGAHGEPTVLSGNAVLQTNGCGMIATAEMRNGDGKIRDTTAIT